MEDVIRVFLGGGWRAGKGDEDSLRKREKYEGGSDNQ